MFRKEPVNRFWTFVVIAVLATPLKAGTEKARPADLTPLLEEIRREFNLPAIAAGVVNADKTLALGATGLRVMNHKARITLRDRFHIGSVSKPMTATMIATLVEDGRLSWTTTPLDVFPELGDAIHPSLRAVTLQELLSHRAGIPPFTKDQEFDELPKFAGSPVMQRRMFTEWLLRRGATSPVGQYEYSNAGYGMAAAMAERRTGKSYESLMFERLFKPLGMKSAGFGWPARKRRGEPWGHREQGDKFIPHSPMDKYQLAPIIAPAGDIHLDIIDFARFAELHLAGLTGQAGLLKTQTFERLHTPFGEYSLGWNVIQTHGFPISFHSGSAGTFYGGVLIYTHKHVAVVIAINASGPKVDVARNKLFNILLSKFSQD